ncbi:cytochrome b/b6 domain-containing protein [Algiphilus sp. W345]|uniref:Cytochrome b/b6 domain-containing protein n=1 Tax=Banduia mediterranea TaxID=3075609 RepID=A0ABU2WG23_9GAMM|nr:cytochrome b/b6 domain-containing protein [Algiphilus sp. W345]MDT0496047.1 cytochrome b/b6 domain-containing protein [Algiphilus sp. W345]
MSELRSYRVWDAPTRWFHWINALCVIGLAAIGLVILNGGTLGVSNAGKIALKTAHVWIGYALVMNLCGRIAWAFVGNRYARWQQVLPVGRQYVASLRGYLASLAAGRPQHYLGHNPLGRISVAVLLALLLLQALTGLLLAGTDIYYPPLGHWFAQWIAAPGVEPSGLVPYSPEMYDKKAYASMRALRSPFATAHVYGFYALLVMAALHIAAVVITELREGGGIVSAMFTGRKFHAGKPTDE